VLITDTTSMEYEKLPVSARGMRTSRKLLREGEALPGMGYYALIAKFHEGDEVFTAPRHRHDFEQIRFGVSGHMDFGPGLECDAGQVAYFPAGAYYGPERIVGAEQLLLQWSREWVTRAQNKEAMEELKKRGSFGAHGLYTYVDEDGVTREIDGPQAVWEWVYQRPQVIREPRYASPIMMSPDAYQWVDQGGQSSKVLGRFTENDVNIQMVRWDDAGVVHHLEPNRTTLAFVLKGAVTVDDQSCGPQTAVWSDFGESHDLIGEAGAEVIFFGFPIDHAGQA
jgi:hypothetical protein